MLEQNAIEKKVGYRINFDDSLHSSVLGSWQSDKAAILVDLQAFCKDSLKVNLDDAFLDLYMGIHEESDFFSILSDELATKGITVNCSRSSFQISVLPIVNLSQDERMLLSA